MVVTACLVIVIADSAAVEAAEADSEPEGVPCVPVIEPDMAVLPTPELRLEPTELPLAVIEPVIMELPVAAMEFDI